MRKLVHCLVHVFVVLSLSFAAESNWPDWRGPDHNRVVTQGSYPVSWDPQNPLWKLDVPGKGYSTPVVWDKTIYLTSGVEGQDTVIAVDWSGEILWQTQLGSEVPGRHQNASGSNSSATTDGSAVFAFFKSGTFAALERDGTVRWKTNLFERFGRDDRFWDFGTSPVLTENNVVMAQMHDGDSWVAAFDRQTGEIAWKVARNYEAPRENRQGYTTPKVYSHNGTEALLVWGAEHLTAYDAADGNMIWSCGNFNPEGTAFWPAIASPVICNDVAIIAFGRADRRHPRLYGVRMGGEGDVTETNHLWRLTDVGTFIPTPVPFNDHVYLISDRGDVERLDPQTGKSVWSGTFPEGRSSFYASPLIAGGHLYAPRIDGKVFVIKLSDSLEIVSEIDMKDRIIASPIALSDRLLIRTERHLYCFGDSAQ